MSAEVEEVSGKKSQVTVASVVAPIIVLGLILMTALYFGLTRYYNSQELKLLVERASENGQSYTVVIHNEFTGRYSFNIEDD